jgi:fucose permease
MSTRLSRSLFGIAVVAFVSLGLPDAVLGVAWPSIRRAFVLPVSQLGLLLAAAMAGYLVSSGGSGPVVARIGVGRVLALSSGLMVASSLGYALAPRWWIVLAAALASGLGAGAVDAAINAFAAVRFPPRLVNWLHASYGVGAMLGPLLISGLMSAGLGWRWGYGTIAVILAAMTIAFARTVERWETRAPAGGPGPRAGEPGASLAATLGRPQAWTGIVLFFVYTGLEVAAGQWSFSLFTEARGLGTGVAGVWVAAYWASLTLGRIVFGALASRVALDTLLRVGMAAATPAALLIWAGPPALGVLGLAGLGFALAPVYPLLMSATPRRLGSALAGHAVGLQVAAAYLGAAVLPAMVGLWARRSGLEVLGPFLVAGTIVLLLAHELALWQSRPGRAAAPASPSAGPVSQTLTWAPNRGAAAGPSAERREVGADRWAAGTGARR